MRIHGEIIVKRRDNAPIQTNYRNYDSILDEDFSGICGYCGKSKLATTKGFEPDHFVPNRVDPTRKTDYYNLVNCCFTCNRKKLGKWPTENKLFSHNNIIGIVDPVLEEYDQHIKRDINGAIVGKTEVGKYMCDKIFKFSSRPIKEIWRYVQILDKQLILETRKASLHQDELLEYIELNETLKDLHKYLFCRKE